MSTPSGARTQRLLAEIRRNEPFRSVIALESELGWPVPLLRRDDTGTRIYLTVPAFRTRPRTGGGVYLLAPHARLTVGWPSGTVVAFHDHSFESPWPATVDFTRPVGAFPHPGLPRDKAGYEHARTAAFGFYDELLTMMSSGQPVPAAWWSRFARVLGPLIEPGLLPFYRILGPKFFAHVLPGSDAPVPAPEG